METLTKFVVFLLVLASVARWRGWNDGWYLMTGLFVAGLPLVSMLAWRLWRPRQEGEPAGDEFAVSGAATARDLPDESVVTADSGPRSPRESFVVGAFRGMLLGFGWSAYLALAFWGMQRMPWWYDRYYDSDRIVMEAKLATLEEAGNFSEVVVALEERLTAKSSDAWRRELIGRLYRDLVSRAQQLSLDDRLPVLARARAVARENAIDDTVARTLEEHGLRERSLAIHIKELGERQDWEGVVELLKSELLRDDRSVETARQLHDAYCAAAVRDESLERQALLYSQAAELARRFGLPADRAQAALSHVEKLRAAQDEKEAHARRLAQLVGEGADTRLQLLEEMLQGASQQPAPQMRLAELTRIGKLAEELAVTLPTLDEQIRNLNEMIAEQSTFLDRVGQLRRDDGHEEAIRQLTAAVRAGDRANWIRPLDQELLGCLVEWCDKARESAPMHESDCLQRAIAVAMECGLEVPSLRLRLDAVQERLTNRDHVRQRIADLKSNHELEKLRFYLEFLIEEEPKAEWALPYGHELSRTLLAQALESNEPKRRCELLRAGLAVALRHSPEDLNDLQSALVIAEAKIQEAERKLRKEAEEAAEQRRRTSPVELLPGTQAGVVRVSTDEWPFIVVDIWVESPDGVPLRGLEHKDFEVTIGGQHAEFFLRSVSIDPAPTNCVFLIDVSGSVAPVLPEVKAAVVNLAADLSRDKTNMKLITFGAEVNADQAWTIDPAIISQQVERLQAIGGTALYRGLNRAIDELVPRPSRERRAVILFTDGKNEDQDGRIGLDHVVDRLTANDISVYSVGLKTRDLDPLVLKRLAGKRGEFLEAANAAELPTRFTATSRALYRNRYRLVIPVNVERVEINDIKKLISFRFSGPLIVEVELPISK